MQETIIRGIAQLATPIGREARHGAAMRELTIVSGAAIWVEDGVIQAVGKEADVLRAAARRACRLSTRGGSVLCRAL